MAYLQRNLLSNLPLSCLFSIFENSFVFLSHARIASWSDWYSIVNYKISCTLRTVINIPYSVYNCNVYI